MKCSPNNPDWRWYEDQIGNEFPLIHDGVTVAYIWDTSKMIERLVLRDDIELIEGGD